MGQLLLVLLYFFNLTSFAGHSGKCLVSFNPSLHPAGDFLLVHSKVVESQINKISRSGKMGLIKQIQKALDHLAHDPRYPGLHSHRVPEFDSHYGGRKIFTSYVQNHTTQAYRILWYYGPAEKQITVVEVIPHY